MAQHRHPSARRKGSHDDSPDDAFIAWILQTWGWIQQNAQVVVLATIVAVVLVAGGLYYYDFQESLASQASTRLEEVQQLAQGGSTSQAITELQSFLDRFSGTPQATEARVLLGQLQLREGNPEEAIPVLEPLGESLGDPMAIQGGFLLAAAYEETDRPERAEEVYLDLANAADLDFRIRDALASAARLRAGRGDHSGAADLYRELVQTVPEDDPAHARFVMLLAESTEKAEAEGNGDGQSR